MKYQKLLSLTRQAVDTYQMINEGDHIAVGISGGKDSLTLLCALYGLKRFYPKSFDLTAITVNLGFQNLDLEPIKRMCRTLEIPYKIVDTQIARIIFEERRENNPCSLCAKMRKGALNAAIKELGCNKIAYAHHKDDVIETMLLSLLYEGRFYSFPPKTYLDQMDLTVIRPLFFVDEADEIGLGGVWLGVAPREDRMKDVEKIVGIPAGQRVFGIFALGYPDEERTQQDRFDQSRIHYVK